MASGQKPGCASRSPAANKNAPEDSDRPDARAGFLFSLVRKPPTDVYASCLPSPHLSSGSASARKTRIIISGTTTARGSSTTRCIPRRSPRSGCAVRSARPCSTWPGNAATRSSRICRARAELLPSKPSPEGQGEIQKPGSHEEFPFMVSWLRNETPPFRLAPKTGLQIALSCRAEGAGVAQSFSLRGREQARVETPRYASLRSPRFAADGYMPIALQHLRK